ncbi:Cytochrome b5 isoform A [Striga hermonthica]|uniref:Cytochrome b5 isoform A n=1 Tax=Striga hermonthica TaxID=68872 RepID=A0A9N7RKB9_STRHE|nr:Cytochrome b5 isoform A [Striga hermonthica]
MEEASQHNTSEDCWIVIDGKVYDVSSYLDEHPGGDDVLLRATGKDATEEFEDAGHSKTARDQMEQFFIGELDQLPPPIPELEIVHKKQEFKERLENVLNLSKQNWVFPVAVVSLSVAVGVLYLKRK